MTSTNEDRLKDLGITTAPTTCNYCRGTGKDFTQPCPPCNGQGSVLVVQPAVKCATCRGTGKDFTSRCNACGGSGWAHTVTL
jgi:DnaJ-class molecular chaperone